MLLGLMGTDVPVWALISIEREKKVGAGTYVQRSTSCDTCRWQERIQYVGRDTFFLRVK